jgi:hypothetical protein
MKPTPAQRQMAVRNREILAKRLGWPGGVLAACLDLERRFPGWDVFWLRENTIKGWERPAGFSARNLDAWHGCERFAEDPVELAALMEQVPEHDVTKRWCSWCLDENEVRLGLR